MSEKKIINMGAKQMVEGKSGESVYYKIDKPKTRIKTDDIDIENYIPRVNAVVLKASRVKRDSGLVLPDSVENTGDLYDFTVFSASELIHDVQNLKKGKRALLGDYSPGVAIFPITIESEDVSYWWTRDHNVIFVEK